MCYVKPAYVVQQLPGLLARQRKQVRRALATGKGFTKPPLLRGIPYAPDPIPDPAACASQQTNTQRPRARDHACKNLDLLTQLVDADHACQKHAAQACPPQEGCSAASGTCRIRDANVIQTILDNPSSAEWPEITDYNLNHALAPQCVVKGKTPYWQALVQAFGKCHTQQDAVQRQACQMAAFDKDVPEPPPLVMDYMQQIGKCLENKDEESCGKHAACSWMPGTTG